MKKLRVKPKINEYLIFVYREAKRVSVVCPNNIIVDGAFINFRYDSKHIMQCVH